MKQMIYVGPTVPGVAERNRIYRGDVPKEIGKMAGKNPYFANLLVPTTQLKTARQDLETKGSVLDVSYRKIEEGLRAGKEGNDGRI